MSWRAPAVMVLMDPGALYLARGVVGHLKDAPAAFDWKKERAA